MVVLNMTRPGALAAPPWYDAHYRGCVIFRSNSRRAWAASRRTNHRSAPRGQPRQPGSPSVQRGPLICSASLDGVLQTRWRAKVRAAQGAAFWWRSIRALQDVRSKVPLSLSLSPAVSLIHLADRLYAPASAHGRRERTREIEIYGTAATRPATTPTRRDAKSTRTRGASPTPSNGERRRSHRERPPPPGKRGEFLASRRGSVVAGRRGRPVFSRVVSLGGRAADAGAGSQSMMGEAE